MELILEGGAAVNGRRILQSEVPAIIDKVDEILSGLGLVKGEDWDMVGSAGKKKEEDTSGDIDVCIKRDRMKEVLGSGDGKNDVFNDLGKYLMELGYDKQHVSFDQVSCGIPINDADDIIQVDFILTRSLEWSRFTQSSPDYRKEESKYKAHVRNVLMMCIVKYCFKRTTKKVTLDDDTIVDGEAEVYVIRLTDGLYKTRKNWLGKRDPILKHAQLMREYDELITDTPQDFINLIFEDGVTVDDFLSFETLFDAFMSDKFKFPENRERILIGYVMSLDSNNPPIDVPTEIPQEYVDAAREKERLAKEREAYNKENKIKRTIKHIETFESFAVRDEEYMINESVVVKKARGGMKVVKEDGTESVLPSITKVLSAMDDKDWYDKWVAKVGKETAVAISKASAHRGTMMHYLLDWYFGGMVNKEELRLQLDSRCPSYTDDERNVAFGLFTILYDGGVFEDIKDVDCLEKSIYSLENGGFWGKTDFVCEKNDGKKVIVDFKSSKSVNTKDRKVDKYKLQLAGYWLAWKETMGEELTGCELWIAHEDSDVPEVIELNGSELRAKCDEFLGMVAMWHEQYAQPVETVLGINEMKNIISFDKFLTQYKSSCRNCTKAISLVEGTVLNTTNTPEDIEYIELNIYDDWIYVDGYIREQGRGYSKHPLAVALYIPPTMWDSLGMTYGEWISQMLEDSEIRELQKSKINIDNPPSGFFELIGFEKNRNIMWLDIDGEEIPFTAYFHKQLFERGGELFRVPPTDRKAQEYIKVLRIGDFN